MGQTVRSLKANPSPLPPNRGVNKWHQRNCFSLRPLSFHINKLLKHIVSFTSNKAVFSLLCILKNFINWVTLTLRLFCVVVIQIKNKHGETEKSKSTEKSKQQIHPVVLYASWTPKRFLLLLEAIMGVDWENRLQSLFLSSPKLKPHFLVPSNGCFDIFMK